MRDALEHANLFISRAFDLTYEELLWDASTAPSSIHTCAHHGGVARGNLENTDIRSHCPALKHVIVCGMAGEGHHPMEELLRTEVPTEQKVSAEEFEDILVDHPQIKRIAIVPMPDQDLGERACAYVIREEGAEITLQDLIAHLSAKRGAKYKFPERLEIVALPFTNGGKVSK